MDIIDLIATFVLFLVVLQSVLAIIASLIRVVI